MKNLIFFLILTISLSSFAQNKLTLLNYPKKGSNIVCKISSAIYGKENNQRNTTPYYLINAEIDTKTTANTLFNASKTGKLIPKAVLSFQNKTNIKLNLTNLLIADYAISLKEGKLVESFKIYFQTMSIK